MALAPTAPAARGPISSASKGIKAVDVSKAPIPLPKLKEGQRCFRSKSRGFQFIVHDIKPYAIDNKVIPGDVKIASFSAQTGFFDGQVYDFGELTTSDPEVIKAIEEHPEYNRLLWDAVTRGNAYAQQVEKDTITKLRENPALLAAVRAELFDLAPQAEESDESAKDILDAPVKRGPGRPRKQVEA